ncbi:MAG: orotidine-5'-phosphate decarboxylase [Deltaproteobacteria bacterium]|nr:orotidine-5'-phosphate decarboxylase [Deltaproteobacteria bacterium]
MTLGWPFSGFRQGGAKSRLIFALDVGSLREAEQLVRTLAREIGLFKIGKQLFLHAGPPVVRMVRDRGGEVFLDLKFHDIPRTVAKAAAEATRMGVRMFDLHASGSLAMMQQTVTEVNRVCRNEQLRRPKILAVTVLTSLTREDLRRVGVQAGVESQVVRLARLAHEASMDGVVASPLEIGRIRRECGRGFLIVTPGVRMAKSGWDDQKRVLTPEQAILAGADYIVVGKPIRDAKDPQAAAREIVAEMERAGAGQRVRGREA